MAHRSTPTVCEHESQQWTKQTTPIFADKPAALFRHHTYPVYVSDGFRVVRRRDVTRECAMRSFTSALVGAAVATIVVSGSLAIAAIPDSTTKIITGCYKKTTGELRVIDKAAKGAKGACDVKTEVELGWNQQGVKGDAGIAGLNGLPGLPGKDATGAGPVTYDATGAVVGSPVYPTTDTFWTGQYMVKYHLTTGKLVRSSAPRPEANMYLTADCTGQAYGIGKLRGTFEALTPPTLYGHPVVNIDSTDLASGWTVAPTNYWAVWVYGEIWSGEGNRADELAGVVKTPGLPFILDAFGSCTPLTSGGGGPISPLVVVQSVALSGLRDTFTGPLSPALSAMPAP